MKTFVFSHTFNMGDFKILKKNKNGKKKKKKKKGNGEFDQREQETFAELA